MVTPARDSGFNVLTCAVVNSSDSLFHWFVKP